MAKIIDITDKLAFDENPVLKIKDVELEVNSDAETVLRIMGMLGGDSTPKEIADICGLIFPDDSQRKLQSLSLKFNDYSLVINAAIDLVIGEEQGE